LPDRGADAGDWPAFVADLRHWQLRQLAGPAGDGAFFLFFFVFRAPPPPGLRGKSVIGVWATTCCGGGGVRNVGRQVLRVPRVEALLVALGAIVMPKADPRNQVSLWERGFFGLGLSSGARMCATWRG